MKKGLAVLLAFCMAVLFSLNVFAAEESGNEYSITTPYEFPVKPGDDEWKDFITTQEMIDAMQIPENILENTTTVALIETMLSSSILEFYCCEDVYYAMEALEDSYNVFRELQSRPDYVESLIRIYENTSLLTGEELEVSNADEHFFDVFNLEVLIAFEMSKSENSYARTNSIQQDWTSVEESYEEKQQIRIQENETYSSNSNGFIWFIENSKGQVDSSSEISLLAMTTATVKTPRQTNVTAYIYDDYTSSEKNKINSDTDAKYPNATRLSGATKKYNCHSYAWYSQNASTNIYWIPNPSAFWSDGSYVVASAGAGRKVRYLSGEHSAIMYTYSSGEIYYQSKWGTAGVYRHSPSYGPSIYNYGAGVTYYKNNS